MTLRRRGWQSISRDPLRILWAEVVKTRDGYACRYPSCLRSKATGWQVHAAHVLGAGSHPRIKYLTANGVTLCAVHHRFVDEHKGRDGEGTQILRVIVGGERYDRLFIEEKIAPKVDKEAVRLSLRAELHQWQAAGVRG